MNTFLIRHLSGKSVPALLSLAFVAGLLLSSLPVQAAPDEHQLGKDKGYPVGTRQNWFFDESVRVGSFSHFETIFPTRKLEKSDSPMPLEPVKTAPDIRYRFGGASYSIDDFLQRQRITGLLIIRNGKILVERYQYGRKASDRFLSFSMAKSITSVALGVALEEGKIKSLDDKIATYIPELSGYPYGEVSIRNVLRMATGVKFREVYTPDDDLARFNRIWQEKNLIQALQAFKENEREPGTRFDYATSNTYLLGLLVSRATGKTLSDYVDEKIWKAMGAESDALFGIEHDGNEYAGSRFMASLRDYGRLGVLLANDGNLNGRQILPKSYLLEATDHARQPEAFAPGRATPYLGYGYQFWLLPGPKRQFELMGVHGQAIYVDPESKTVMVHTGVAKEANIFSGSMGQESAALWASLVGAAPENASTAAPALPQGVIQLIADVKAAFANNDMGALAALYHPNFLSSGRDKAAQLTFLGSQAMGRVKRWELRISEFRQEGNVARFKGVFATEAGDFPTESSLIDDGGRWYFYGDRRH